jgi:hypothetical protein
MVADALLRFLVVCVVFVDVGVAVTTTITVDVALVVAVAVAVVIVVVAVWFRLLRVVLVLKVIFDSRPAFFCFSLERVFAFLDGNCCGVVI